jgi:HD superfamily phosphodiesterase
MDVLYNFIDKFCKENNIDSSHDVTHSKDCVRFAEKIMDPMFTDQEKSMTLYAAALHDCVDKKYVDPVTSALHIHQFLSSIGWSDEDADALLAMVRTMSYSKLKSEMVDRFPVFPDHGKWQRIYHIVRQSDLLCSYHVHRCYQYQLRIHPDWSEDAHWERIQQIFQTRIFKYVSDGWFQSRSALLLIPALVEQAKQDIEARNGNVPAEYRI